jgi:hypothetical protein
LSRAAATDRLRGVWTTPFAADDGPDDDDVRRMSAPEDEIPVALHDGE